MMPAPAARRKPSSYRPRVTFLSATEYLVPSQSYAPHLLYMVSVKASGQVVCECDGYTYRGTCKHSRLVQAIHAYRQRPTHLKLVQPTETPSAAPATMPHFTPVPSEWAWA